MDFKIQDLHAIEGDDISLESLPGLCSRFFIPTLPDKPQNPIMDTLDMRREQRTSHAQATSPASRDILRVSARLDAEKTLDDNFWERVGHEPHKPSNAILSWDTLRTSFDRDIVPSAFLSQRSLQVFMAARRYVNPSFEDALVKLIFTVPQELFDSLQITLSGISSPLHVWDPVSESFKLRGVEPGKRGFLVLEGMDQTISQSLIQRFLSIGTITRRLEIAISELQNRSTTVEPSLHAFGHALWSVLHTIKGIITDLAHAASTNHQAVIHALSTLWMGCSDIESDLVQLAGLCHRDVGLQPAEYLPIPTSTPDLLSAIYKRLEGHLHSRLSRTAAIFAYLLTAASADYFKYVCRSVGYGPQDLNLLPSGLHEDAHDKETIGPYGEEPVEGDETLPENCAADTFPCFFTADMTQAIQRARQSLKLLLAAHPQHHLLTSARSQQEMQWFWTEEAVTQAWEPVATASSPLSPETSTSMDDSCRVTDSSSTDTMIEDGLQAFRLFDLEPGSHMTTRSLGPTIESSTHSGFQVFLKTFPEYLPSLTPSLLDLTELVLSPLAVHVDALSSALLDIFLSSDGYLSLHSHMVLLRSYLLLTSQPFKSRLQSALFSDSPEPVTFDANARSIAVQAYQTHSTSDQVPKSSESWVLGLASGLTSAGWPPASADLSYSLRTVIIDALDVEHPDRQLSENASTTSREKSLIFEEAEWRLGFAIRDLPTGSGHAKWLNPKAMEALDFLYMDYQPPHPLDVLISPTTLSKYHRLFAFNLRLMRVESVVNALFRMTIAGATPPFVTLASSQKLFLHFRFFASSFVTSLASYVYDTAIGNNVDAFLRKLTHRTSGAQHNPHFSDVFALADYHSRVMDDILSACLLRSGQKAIGDILRGVLDIVLQFGILICDRQRGVFEEYQAAAQLEELFDKFRRRVKTLVKVLKALIDKGGISSRVPAEDVQLQVSADTLTLPQAVGVAADLYNLFVRLDASLWWTRGQQT